jgi:predicted SAM-dependent methyltransferase
MSEKVLDIGCGPNKASKDYFGVDINGGPGVDVICDFERPLPFLTDSVDMIVTRHTLEHVQNLEQILREFSRIVKPGGRLSITVPHFSNTLGFSDYTHKRFFGYYTFDYFSRQRDRYWAVPNYTRDIWFTIVSKRFNFKNLSVLSGPMGWLFNRGGFWSYFYESKLSWVLPCFEIEFQLLVDKPAGAASARATP